MCVLFVIYFIILLLLLFVLRPKYVFYIFTLKSRKLIHFKPIAYVYIVPYNIPSTFLITFLIFFIC